MPYYVYRIRRLRIGQNLVVQYGRFKPGTGDYNCTNVERIRADEIPVAKTIEVTTSHCE